MDRRTWVARSVFADGHARRFASALVGAMVCSTACGRSEVGLLDVQPSGGGTENRGRGGSGGEGATATGARGGDGASGTGVGGGSGGQAVGGASLGGTSTGGSGTAGSGARAGSSGDGGAGEGACDSVVVGAEPTVPFAFQLGDSMNQSGKAIIALPDGSLFVAGAFEGTLDLGGDTFESGFGDDPFVARFDPKGRHLFSRHFSGARVALFDVAASSSGERLYGAGDFWGTADFGAGDVTSEGSVSAFLVALDACGRLEGIRAFGAENARVSIANVATIGESVVVAGTFEGSLDLGDGLWTRDASGSEAFVARFDRSLELVWSHRLGGAGHLVVATEEEKKTVYVAGSLDGTINLRTETLTGYGRAFVLKLDSKGRPLWVSTDQIEELGSSSWPEEIIVDEGGNLVVLVDLLYKSIAFDDSVKSDWTCCGPNVFALSIHPDGIPLRLTAIDRLVTARIVRANGGFIVVTSDGGAHGFDVRHYDLFGAVTSSRRFAAPSYVDVFGVSEEPSGSLLITGSFRGNLDLGSGPFEPTVEFDWDGFVARLPSAP